MVRIDSMGFFSNSENGKGVTLPEHAKSSASIHGNGFSKTSEPTETWTADGQKTTTTKLDNGGMREVVKMFDKDGNVVSTQIIETDANGRQVYTKVDDDFGVRETKYVRDDQGRVIKQTSIDSSGTSTLEKVYKDDGSRVETTIQANGDKQVTTYDNESRIIKESNNGLVTYERLDNGREMRAEMTDDGIIVKRIFDSNDKKLRQIQINPKTKDVTTFDYDKAGKKVETRTFNPTSRQVTVRDASGKEISKFGGTFDGSAEYYDFH